MDYEKFCLQILDVDPKIRFAAVFDTWANQVAGGLRQGLTSELSEHAEKELQTLSILNWKSRKSMQKWLGKTIYTLAEHEKIKRFSFYLGDEYLLRVSTEKDCEIKKVVDGVIELYYKNQ